MKKFFFFFSFSIFVNLNANIFQKLLNKLTFSESSVVLKNTEFDSFACAMTKGMSASVLSYEVKSMLDKGYTPFLITVFFGDLIYILKFLENNPTCIHDINPITKQDCFAIISEKLKELKVTNNVFKTEYFIALYQFLYQEFANLLDR